jgi:hypothetical protein
MPNAFKHVIDGLWPEAGLTSASGATKIDTPEHMTTADRFKVGLGFQLASRNQAREEQHEKINAQQSARLALAAAENRVANLADRGLDSREAMADITKLVAQGVKMRIYPNFADEMKRVNFDLRRKHEQRINPLLGSRTMQRMGQAQKANP